MGAEWEQVMFLSAPLSPASASWLVYFTEINFFQKLLPPAFKRLFLKKKLMKKLFYNLTSTDFKHDVFENLVYLVLQVK